MPDNPTHVSTFVCPRTAPAPHRLLDPDFANGGATTTPGLPTGAHDIAIAPGGQIVLAAHGPVSASTTTHAHVLRYNPDGSPDASFGGGDGGIVSVRTGQNSYAHAVAVQPDGK